MKKLFICTPTFSVHGGVERIMEALARDLPKRGIEVVFGLAKGRRFHDPQRFLAAYPNIDAVEIDGTSGSPFGRREAIKKAIRDVDPDIVLVARLFDAYPACAALKAEGHRLRLAVTIQAYEPEYLMDAWRYRAFIDCCVTSGNLVAKAVREIAGIPPECVVSIPGGVSPPRRERRASPVLRLGYIGRIEQRQKRALDLADLLDELRRRGADFRCVVAGSGPAEEELRRRAGGTAEFRGWLSHDELYEEIYPELDVFLHFAAWEGITIAPREAMAHGVVPVVSRFTGMAAEEQFIEGVNALTFAVGDVRGAADAVQMLDRDRALLERLSAAARASQSGIRSEEGAADAWASALLLAIERDGQIGPLPLEQTVHGRLDRVLPLRLAEFARRVLGRRFRHEDPGSEWPHWSGRTVEEILVRARQLERDSA